MRLVFGAINCPKPNTFWSRGIFSWVSTWSVVSGSAVIYSTFLANQIG